MLTVRFIDAFTRRVPKVLKVPGIGGDDLNARTAFNETLRERLKIALGAATKWKIALDNVDEAPLRRTHGVATGVATGVASSAAIRFLAKPE